MLKVPLDQPAVLTQWNTHCLLNHLQVLELSLVLTRLGDGREEPASHTNIVATAAL